NTTADSVSTNQGILSGNAGYGPGKVGPAFVFDGNNDGVLIGSPGALKLQDLSIEAWVRGSDPTVATANGESGGAFLGGDTGGYHFGVYNDAPLNLAKIGFRAITTPAILVDTNF